MGIDVYIESHVKSKVTQWVKELELLAAIAISQPQTAHAALTHGLSSKWLYLSRMTPKIGHLLKILELTIKTKLFLAITCRPPPSNSERKLLALPVSLGGIAIPNPVKQSNMEFSASLKVTLPLKNAILQQASV